MLNLNDMFVNFVIRHKHNRVDETSSMLWHRRLGHISRPQIERFIKKGILHDHFLFLYLCCLCKGQAYHKSKKYGSKHE